MPEIKPVHVLNFSSENKSFPADNLLKVNEFSKWKCQEAGTNQAVVSFKFDRCYQIHRIDIGNEGSAFIEVHVSRSSSSADTDEVLLPSSSFMSLADAKAGTSLNRVRIFSHNELTPTVAAQKWDIAKVICTQPFNKTIQYGLSFIRFYIPAEEEEKQNTETFTKSKVASASSLSDDREDDAILKPGGLFNMSREKKLKNEKAVETITQKILSHNHAIKKYIPTSKSHTLNATPLGSVVMQKYKSPSQKPTTSKPAAPNSTVQGNKPSTSTAHSHHRKPLNGVVVAFSGYQNPLRSELRSMCLKLGAKYCQDWNDQCTHLICAFPNTPKWRSVKGVGVITSHKWIEACNLAKRRVSWRPFRVGQAPSPPGHISDTQDDGDGDRYSSDSELAPMEVDNGDTDDELHLQLGVAASTTTNSANRHFPGIFTDKHFFLFSKNLPVKEEEILDRLIINFGGKIDSYMTADVDFVISNSTWCAEFDDALIVSPKIIFVKSDWLHACKEASKLVPFQRYQVVG